MEQDCIAGVYQCLGLSLGAEFSSEDVSVLYGKVFRVPSDTDEAHTAMKKIAGGDISWSCVGEKVFDVLVEMEREREKKEKLYWDLQLMNGGNVNSLYVMDKLLQSTNTKANNSDTGSLHSCTTVSPQTQRLVGKNELYGSMRGVMRLKKAARQCWIRLASEGVQSILPSHWHVQSLKVKGQAWGCVSPSDALLLLDVKYDVMSHLLYSEMLQEHHTPSVWETLLPSQRQSEEEELEDIAEEAYESGDMLRLAELPGAFRMYRACLGASFNSRELSWSAASFLCELHTSRQQEKDKVAVLGERLDGESWKLLCLYIRLATLRAQREKLSYRALLAAKQSWDTWPHVHSPCQVEQAALWLRHEEEAENENFISGSPQQQAALQLLVLTQEQERKQLVKLVHGVSLEDLQGPVCTAPPKDGSNKLTVLRSGCMKMLRQIHASMQRHNETQPLFEQSTSKPQLQPQTQAHMCSKAAVWSHHQLEDCSLLLVTRLLELHDLHASAFLSLLKNKSAQHLQVLRDEYESELRTQSNTNLLQFLTSDAPSTLVSKSCNEQKTAEYKSAGPAEVSAAVSVRGADSELNGIQAADVTNTQDVCTDCGAVVEEMPYLEILCVSDATSKTHLASGGGCREEEGGNVTKSPQTYEKQGSLITMAWSKPPEDDEDDCDTADRGKSQDSESSMRIQVLQNDMSRTAEYTQCEETPGKKHEEELKPTLLQSAAEQCSTDRQLTLEERTVVGQPHKGEDASEYNLQTHALVAETLKHVQPHLFTELEQHSDDLCTGPSDETAEVGRDGVDVEVRAAATESELCDPREPDPTPSEDQTHNSQFDCGLPERDARRESMLMERERVREPVSALEREKTIRNLVDMQRKVEQRHQRDRERQLLRVQERLSIIQNRKAEEDLLGLKHTERLRHLTEDLPQEDKNQQKTVVRERLEQLRRERSYVLQSKRDRNTAGFKELLAPVALHSRETEDGAD